MGSVFDVPHLGSALDQLTLLISASDRRVPRLETNRVLFVDLWTSFFLFLPIPEMHIPYSSGPE